MEQKLEKLVIERIKREIEPNVCITPQTTPVVFFGDYDNAKACTIALHPSDREFLDENGNILIGDDRRFYSRKELGKKDLEELSDDDAEKVLECCKKYFKVKFKPYIWFKELTFFIEKFGYSYYDNDSVSVSNFKKCVHLNLVQWASSPSWGDIKDEKIIPCHLKNDLPILKYLLEKKFEYIFLDGDKVVSEVKKLLGIILKEEKTTYINNKGVGADITIYFGKYNGAEIIGWSEFLPSPPIGYFHLHQAINNVIANNAVPGAN
jgi:hypothetical protein